MSTNKLFRLSGIALLLGGLFSLVGETTHMLENENPQTTLWVVASLLMLTGALLLTLGVPAIYLRQAERMPIFGVVCFVLFFFAGIILGVGNGVVDAFILPYQRDAVVPVLTRFFLLGQPVEIAQSVINTGPYAGLTRFYAVGEFCKVFGGIPLAILTLRMGLLSRGASWLFIASILFSIVGVLLRSVLPLIDHVGLLMLFISLAWYGYSLFFSARSQGSASASIAASLSAQHILD